MGSTACTGSAQQATILPYPRNSTQPDWLLTRTARTRPFGEVKVLYDYEIPNAPGKSIVCQQVDFPPNAFTPPHRHGGATVSAVVISGEVLSGMNGNPPEVYGPGGTFLERPGCHHTVAENNSATEPATLLATFVVDTEVLKVGGYGALTVVDEDWIATHSVG